MIPKKRTLIAIITLICVFASSLASCSTTESDRTQSGASSEITAQIAFEDTSSDTESAAPDEKDSGSSRIAPPDVEGEVSTPLMWRVASSDGDGELYLLGSIHAGFADACLFAPEVYAAFDSCGALAVESDVVALESDLTASVEAMKLFVYTDGSTIEDHIPDDVYESAKKIMEEGGMFNRFMDHYCPALWTQSIEQILTERSGFEYSNGVDRYFLGEAKRLGKRVIEIEDYMETYLALASLSEKTQAYLLEYTSSEEYVAGFEDDLSGLYRAWKRGDADALEMFLDGGDDIPEDDLAFREEYNDALISGRNEIMIEKAVDLLNDGEKVFYVVGLAHMLGEDGIVEGLGSRGYTVEQVKYK